MTRDEFTLKDAIKIQSQQLADWKLKLTDEVYQALEAWAIENNDSLVNPFHLRRGCDLSTFIANYKPKPTQTLKSFIIINDKLAFTVKADDMKEARTKAVNACNCSKEIIIHEITHLINYASVPAKFE